MKIAHISELGEVQTVKDHLQGTAERARRFASEFGCADMGYLCGLMHDIGKYSEEFQKRIHDPEHTRRVDHSTAGAKELCQLSRVAYTPAAMAVAGHHSGLLDGGNGKFAQAQDGTFYGRLKSVLPEYGDWKEEIVPGTVDLPSFCTEGKSPVFTMSFFIRMLYSCLVDADYLDTEAFMKLGAEDIKRGDYSSVPELLNRFQRHIAGWFEEKKFDNDRQERLCRNRNRILQECMEKGERADKGLYTLTVPTGGGKTTASLGFALKHVQARGMKRIIYVIPYTSVIDQNAAVFSRILGEENVLEHHSGILYEMTEDQQQNEKMYRKVLATENWDKPVIVTTAVQFFESLFANKSSKCRKLHNIANSVIIFDEAQTLPVAFLEPCVAAMAELAAHYGSTIVLCTATQPALGEVFRQYLPNKEMKEICSNAESLYEEFRRTRVEDVGTVELEKLQEKLWIENQVLCIVNKRKTAQELYKGLKAEGTYCLTTLLYPASRKAKIREIKQRLQEGLPCRVIATSLIEAGVDLDFPKVYRQESGLDSVIQAAGRCNREGIRNQEDSVVSIFRMEEDRSPFLAQNIAALQWVQKKYDDVSAPDAIKCYFHFYRNLLGRENLDQKEIIKAFERGINGKSFPFAAVAKQFQLIENEMITIYIPLEEGATLTEMLSAGKADREVFRKLGQYSVNIYPNHLKVLWDGGCLEQIDGTVFVLRDLTQYDMDTGLKMDVDTGNGVFV